MEPPVSACPAHAALVTRQWHPYIIYNKKKINDVITLNAKNWKEKPDGKGIITV
jgi:hypothetical protein